MKIGERLNRLFSKKEYDEDGNLIYQILLNGTEIQYEYVDGGYIIHTVYPTGEEKWMAFDSNSILLYVCENDGGQMWFDHKKEGMTIRTKYKDGNEEYFTYNSHGILVESKTIVGNEEIKTKIQTDSNGLMHKIETEDCTDETFFYPNGNIKEYTSTSKNNSFRQYFDEDGNEIVQIEKITS